MNNVVSFILEQKNKNLDIDELREIGEDYFFDGNFLKAFYYLYKAAQKDCFYSMSLQVIFTYNIINKIILIKDE